MAGIFDGLNGGGFSSGFAQGNAVRKQLGLASGVQDYVNAEASGDKAGMQKALGLMAGYAPTETLDFINSRDRIGKMTPYQQAMLNMEQKKLDALETKKAQEEQIKEETKQKTLNDAQMGVNLLKDVADSDVLGKAQGVTSWFDDDVQKAQGRVSSAIAALAPTAIQRLKDAGVSGVNTLGEFMTYVGLPEKPTSQQIAGALPQIASIVGVQDPYGNKNGIIHTQDSGRVNSNQFSSMSDEELLRGL